MLNCDTLIIGSGYSSAGFALTENNCLIAEETEMCDTHFYLPLQCYEYKDFAPSENLSAELFDTFQKFGLFKNSMQNVNFFRGARPPSGPPVRAPAKKPTAASLQREAGCGPQALAPREISGNTPRRIQRGAGACPRGC